MVVQETQRDISLDIIRILATLAVITIHVTGLHWLDQDITSFSWQTYNIFRAAVRWAVPVFIMLSGALFLNPQKDFSIKKLYGKNILRIVTAFVFWSFIYALYENDRSALDFLGRWIKGAGHMWFIFLILGLYSILPILRRICESELLMKGFLVTAFILGFLLPALLESIPAFMLRPILDGLPLLCLKLFQKAFGWSGYYVLGWYLVRFRKVRKGDLHSCYFIYAAGLLAFISSVFLYRNYAFRLGYAPDEFYDNISLTVLLEAIAVFIALSNMEWNVLFTQNAVIRKISDATFGIYMVHMLVFYLLDAFTADYSCYAVIWIPVMIVVVTFMSYCIVVLIQKIPGICKYIT